MFVLDATIRMDTHHPGAREYAYPPDFYELLVMARISRVFHENVNANTTAEV